MSCAGGDEVEHARFCTRQDKRVEVISLQNMWDALARNVIELSGLVEKDKRAEFRQYRSSLNITTTLTCSTHVYVVRFRTDTILLSAPFSR